MLEKSNFLLLDEPTNNLDLNSKEILLDALRQYTGSILFIAHDRYFMDALAEKVFELKDGRLHTYLGNYAEYLQKISAQQEAQAAAEVKPETALAGKSFYKSKEQKKQEAQLRQQYSKWKKEVLEPLENLEVTIAHGESRLRELEGLLAKSETYGNKDQFHQTIEEYQELKSRLENHYKDWERLQSRVGEKDQFTIATDM